MLRQAIADLSPGYFAMVMATGIVSIAARLTGWPGVPMALLGLNAVIFVVLWGLYLARLILEPRRFLADLSNHARGVGFFTTAAGTCVLGNQFILVLGWPRPAEYLWFLGIALWLVLTYAIFALLVTRPEKPPLDHGLNGAWLLAVVAAQAVSSLGSLLAGSFPGQTEVILFFSLTTWLAGGMLYTWIISIIFYRYMFLPLTPSDLTPPYWINMGAMAISTLAGTLLIGQAEGSPTLTSLMPFLKGFTLVFWAKATLWIPMLAILGIWRHLVMRFPLRYDPGYWGAVFPLGMYAACTARLADVLDLPFLWPIPRAFTVVAMIAWLVVALALVGELASAGISVARRSTTEVEPSVR